MFSSTCNLCPPSPGVLHHLPGRHGLNLISGLHSESYDEKLKELNLLLLKERRERADMIQTFKILQGFSDVNPETWFSRINHSQVTRNRSFKS